MPLIYLKEFGDAVISRLRTAITDDVVNISGLTTNRVDWARGIYTEPVYIMNPNLELPRVKIRFNNVQTSLGPQVGLKSLACIYEYSIFYYRKQTKGQDHQVLLLEDLEQLTKVFSNNQDQTNIWRPLEFNTVGNNGADQQLQTVYPFQIVQYPEMHHNIDYSGIRISSGEIRLQITSFSYPVVES